MDRWQTWTCHLKPWVTGVHWITGMWRHQPLNAEVSQGRHRIVPKQKTGHGRSRHDDFSCRLVKMQNLTCTSLTHTHTSQECCFSNWILYLCNFTRASTMTATYDIIAHVCAFNCSHNTSQIHAVENRSWLGIQACPLHRHDNVVVPRLWNHLNLSGWLCTCMFSAILVCTVI